MGTSDAPPGDFLGVTFGTDASTLLPEHTTTTERRTSRRTCATNLLITAIGLTLFAGINARSGHVEANDGLGWDGRQYAHMVTDRIYDGTAGTQTRPLLPLLTRIPYKAGLDIILAFRVMNFLYAAVLYFFLCLILDLYDLEAIHKGYFVVTVALCIATSRMFAFYPTLIDLGVLAISSASTYVVMTRNGWKASMAAILAVSAREFLGALAIFGFHRELRRGQSLALAFLTYAPAVAMLFVLRNWARTTNLGDRDRPLATVDEMFAFVGYWLDPPFIAFFLYFLVTLLGGVTLLLVLRPSWCVRQIAHAPELATYAALIVAGAAVGIDIWRYLVFLLPVLTILFAAYVRDFRPGIPLLLGALLVTLVTQKPFFQMDMMQYFRDWFPAYVYRTDDATPDFWWTWQIRITMTVAAAIGLATLQWTSSRGRTRSARSISTQPR